MVYKRLEELRAQRNISAGKMGEIIGISGPGYSKMIRERSCRVDYLENMAKFFNVPVTEFFDDELIIGQNLNEKNYIKEILNEKERYIQRLEKDNNQLDEKCVTLLRILEKGNQNLLNDDILKRVNQNNL